MNTPMPKTLGKYEIKSVLGSGAMGTVYEGFDPGIEREVALKTVRTDVLESGEKDEILARFRREATAAGRLSHANIVTVFDFGEAEDVTYIAMELVRGRTLKDVFDKNERLCTEDVLIVVEELLNALGYAHEQGVVHRDIKPENIILEGGDLRKTKIMDFGIARIESSNLTQVGTIMGTPSYMSPEQFTGQVVDLRTDLYAVGVILYQFLTGEKPFTGAIATVMHKALNEIPVRPSILNIQSPTTIDRVVEKAMAKAPADRFQTAALFLRALKRAAAGEDDEDAVEAAADATMNLGADPAADADATQVLAPEAAADTDVTLPPAAAPAAPDADATGLSAAVEPASAASPLQNRKLQMMAAAGIAVLIIAGAGGWWLQSGSPDAPQPVAGQPDAGQAVAGGASSTPAASSPATADKASADKASAPRAAEQAKGPAALRDPEEAKIPFTGGRISVVTIPPGAKITLADGKVLGASPAKLKLAPGIYDFIFVKDGYYNLESNVEIGAGDDIPFEVNLTKKPEG